MRTSFGEKISKQTTTLHCNSVLLIYIKMLDCCCLCENVFSKRAKGKGFEKRSLLGRLRNEATTAFEALQILHSYKVETAADLRLSL